MSAPKILILYVGGTIGMQKGESGYRPFAGFEDVLHERLQQNPHPDLPDYDLIALPNPIDSANLKPSDWSIMAQALQNHWENYTGFVVLHGTDTLAYTASALSFMLRNMDKPVIITGSQIPLMALRNDAFANVVTSLILAAHYPIYEVLLYFNGRILRGNRSRKMSSTSLLAFDSPNFDHLGQAGVDIELRHDLLLKKSMAAISFHQSPFLDHAVALLPMYPGIHAQMYQSMLHNPDLKAIVLLSYGVGNPPDQNEGLMSFFKEAHDKGMVSLNLSQCAEGVVDQGAYATGVALEKVGVISGFNLTPEAAFAKLHVLISEDQDSTSLRERLTDPISGECHRL